MRDLKTQKRRGAIWLPACCFAVGSWNFKHARLLPGAHRPRVSFHRGSRRTPQGQKTVVLTGFANTKVPCVRKGLFEPEQLLDLQ
jgi:hypothetical protein